MMRSTFPSLCLICFDCHPNSHHTSLACAQHKAIRFIIYVLLLFLSVWFYVLAFLSLKVYLSFLASDWDREKLLEAWMTNAEECCQRSGVQMPNPPPSGCNAWDTLPSPRTPRTTRSSITSPDQISLMPADEESSLVRDVFGFPFFSVCQINRIRG